MHGIKPTYGSHVALLNLRLSDTDSNKTTSGAHSTHVNDPLQAVMNDFEVDLVIWVNIEMNEAQLNLTVPVLVWPPSELHEIKRHISPQ